MRYSLGAILICGFCLLIGCDRQPQTVPSFRKYRSEAFVYWIGEQTNVARNFQDSNFLAMTSSLTPQGSAYYRYFVKLNGQIFQDENRYNWSTEDWRHGQLSDAQFATLTSAIRELPARFDTPPGERLLIVSFRDGSNWVTRSFDKKSPPPSLTNIFNLIGGFSLDRNPYKRKN